MSKLINWSELKTYTTNQNKSFEELCYQLAFEEYSSKGKLTSIDDSGGGDGVEFYLEFPNGDIWGWQCKFFGRFDEGGRKEQIKSSLQRAYDKHGSRLKKWVLSSQLSLTPTEKTWFETSLAGSTRNRRTVLPLKHTVELEHWGDSKILNLLRKYQDIHNYFFIEKILENDWFKTKFELVSNSRVIKSKYLNGLHVSGEADEKVIQVLCDKRLADLIDKSKEILDVDRFLDEYQERVDDIRKEENIYDFTNDYYKIKKFILSNDYPNIIQIGNDLLGKSQEFLRNEDLKSFTLLIDKMVTYKKKLDDFYIEYSNLKTVENIPSVHWDTEEEVKEDSQKRKMKSCRETILGPYFTLRNFIDAYRNIFQCFEYRDLNELHISGHASKGKTHLATNIVEHQINQNKPAIFLFGKDFKSNLPLREQLKSLLDLPTDWSISDFLGALNISGRVNKTKAILLIDGLNESIYWKQIWGTSLETLITEINQKYSNILIITTYRKSYEKQLFPKDYFHYSTNGWMKEAIVEGFNSQNINEAIDKYFGHYDIEIVNSSSAMNHFSEPLYLKIFCEAKHGQKVSFQSEDLFDVFDEYLTKSNNRIVENLGLEPRYNKTFSKEILEKISNYFWVNSRRDIDLKDLMPSIVNEEQLIVFEGEDLLIFRDWGQEEIVTFTYDLLSGYLIAKIIIKKITSIEELQTFFNSEKLKKELLERKTLHPLYNDILRCFSVLAIKKFGLSFYNDKLHKTLKEYLLRSIFEVNTNTIIVNKDIVLSIIREVFSSTTNKDTIYKLFKNTELDHNHPLNFELLSTLLFEMTMSDRDVSWTEYIRKEYGHYSSGRIKNFIEDFEEACIEREDLSDRVHLAAKKIMWFLTSSNLEMRDKSTKALYHYGRRYPKLFFELVQYSLKINDPYVWQRTLASLYGVVLAKHNDWKSPEFKDEFMPIIAKRLYKLVFSKDAPHGTTNIIARDYVRRTIQICLKHHPEILIEKEINNTIPPYKFGGIRNWGEYDYGDHDYGYDGPMRMDFSNYTIGHIVPNGHSYSDPPEKQQVRRQIYWRIYDLGWESEKFANAEKGIGNETNYNSRTEKPKIERYGKKYSWIAYYEIYGYREDNDFIQEKWSDFRVSESDIDPSFPVLPENKPFIKDDILGDRGMSLLDWYNDNAIPYLNDHLVINNLNEESNDWVCLDGFISQEDKQSNREVFVFIRGMIVKEDDYNEFLNLIKVKDFSHNRIPSVSENYYTFAGEMNMLDEATYDNFRTAEFETGRKKRIVKKGEPGYFPRFVFNKEDALADKPDEMVIDEIQTKDFDILMPVAQYNWESHHSSLNQAGHQYTVSKEVSSHLNLIDAPQTFNLFEKNGKLASINLRYRKDYNTNQHFVYLRKDLFDKYLEENKYKFIWGLWGEKEFSFEEHGALRQFTLEHNIDGYKNLKQIIPYK
ncbi:hypothetical protein [Kordia sp.]|uniref:hypothetical protein n=1 Tax=Kordia sp. TaxID=1965332 RepID=UPI003D28DDD2